MATHRSDLGGTRGSEEARLPQAQATSCAKKRSWSTEHVNDVEAHYRRFLALKMVYRGRLICPTDEIGAFWHAHILDTRAYERDCHALFGQYLHHYPYLGMDGRAGTAPPTRKRWVSPERSSSSTSASTPALADHEAGGAAYPGCA